MLPSAYICYIPHLYSFISNTKLSRLNKSNAMYKRMKSFLRNKKYNGNSTGNHILAMGLTTNPQLSLSGAEILPPASLVVFWRIIMLKQTPVILPSQVHLNFFWNELLVLKEKLLLTIHEKFYEMWVRYILHAIKETAERGCESFHKNIELVVVFKE